MYLASAAKCQRLEKHIEHILEYGNEEVIIKLTEANKGLKADVEKMRKHKKFIEDVIERNGLVLTRQADVTDSHEKMKEISHVVDELKSLIGK